MEGLLGYSIRRSLWLVTGVPRSLFLEVSHPLYDRAEISDLGMRVGESGCSIQFTVG